MWEILRSRLEHAQGKSQTPGAEAILIGKFGYEEGPNWDDRKALTGPHAQGIIPELCVSRSIQVPWPWLHSALASRLLRHSCYLGSTDRHGRSTALNLKSTFSASNNITTNRYPPLYVSRFTLSIDTNTTLTFTNTRRIQTRASEQHRKDAPHIFYETIKGSYSKSLSVRENGAWGYVYHGWLLIDVYRPPSSRTLLHHHPAQNQEDSSERAVSVSDFICAVDIRTSSLALMRSGLPGWR
jgi:hypothetical protein